MSAFYIIDESTEDTLAATESLEEALGMVPQAALQGQPGDLIAILESGGKAVKQFILMPDGKPAEQAIPRQPKPGIAGKTIGVEIGPYQADRNAAPESEPRSP